MCHAEVLESTYWSYGINDMGKQTKSSHPKVNAIATSRPLELLHVDLMGLTRTESLGGKRYIML